MTMKEEAARACEALRRDDTGTDEVLGYNRAVRDCAAAVRAAFARQPKAEQPAWTTEPPTEQGDYWHWTGDDDHAPMIYHVMWSGTAKKCFLSIGQYDITSAVWCDEFGGHWMKIEQPSTSAKVAPASAQNAQQPKKAGGQND